MYVLVRKKGNKMKKLIKIIILVVLVMVSGCAIQKKEENAKVTERYKID